MLTEPERAVAITVQHFAQEPADGIARLPETLEQAHGVAKAGGVPQLQGIALRRGQQGVRFRKHGHVGGVAHFADIHAHQGARQRRLAIIRMRNQRKLNLHRIILDIFIHIHTHAAADTFKPTPASSGCKAGLSKLTRVAVV